MIWSSVVACCPAVVSSPERLASVATLLRDLGQGCPGIVVHVVPQWRPEPDPPAGRAAIAAALRSCSRPWVLYLEDDAELCSGFGALAAALLPLPDDIGALSLFSSCSRDPERLRHGVTRYEAPRPFRMAQCLLLRRELAHAWADSLDTWTGHPGSPDCALTPAADRLGLRIMVSLPSLAQHRPINSAFGNSGGAQSRTFTG